MLEDWHFKLKNFVSQSKNEECNSRRLRSYCTVHTTSPIRFNPCLVPVAVSIPNAVTSLCSSCFYDDISVNSCQSQERLVKLFAWCSNIGYDWTNIRLQANTTCYFFIQTPFNIPAQIEGHPLISWDQYWFLIDGPLWNLVRGAPHMKSKKVMKRPRLNNMSRRLIKLHHASSSS